MTRGTVVTVVQARGGSTRFPRKILQPLAGEPALARMVERLHAAALVGTVVVATTREAGDDEIARLCRRLDVPCIRGHTTDLLDRHRQVALAFQADHIVKIPSDCPLIDPAVVDRTIGLYLARLHRYDFVSNLHPATDPDGVDVEVFTRDALEMAWREATLPHQREHTTPFLWDQPERFRLGNSVRPDCRDLSRNYRLVLDYPEDLDVIGPVFEALYRDNPRFTVDDAIDWLDRHPEVAERNARYRGVNWYRDHLALLRTVNAADTRHPDPVPT